MTNRQLTNALTNLAAAVSPRAAKWFATASMQELMDDFCESHKERHGVKGRWVYGAGYSREDFARMAREESMGEVWAAVQSREDAEMVVARLAELGMEASIADVWNWTAYSNPPMGEVNPQPLPYEGMVPGQWDLH